ncbi:hypothetical protein [Streptomyces sp. S1]|uniref:hypothetical protein n=1 Tax=Streptomyces sp. S1 TaxID=718288 RepID=UPI003D7307AB
MLDLYRSRLVALLICDQMLAAPRGVPENGTAGKATEPKLRSAGYSAPTSMIGDQVAATATEVIAVNEKRDHRGKESRYRTPGSYRSVPGLRSATP